MDEAKGFERVSNLLANWLLVVTAPVWCPVAFYWAVLGHKSSIRALLTGKEMIFETQTK